MQPICMAVGQSERGTMVVPASERPLTGVDGNVEDLSADGVLARRPVLVVLYESYLEDQDAANFIKCVSRRYSKPTLERLSEFGDRTSRRASVLALGYIGDYSSNTALGRALVDRDRGVRTIAENSIRALW